MEMSRFHVECVMGNEISLADCFLKSFGFCNPSLAHYCQRFLWLFLMDLNVRFSIYSS